MGIQRLFSKTFSKTNQLLNHHWLDQNLEENTKLKIIEKLHWGERISALAHTFLISFLFIFWLFSPKAFSQDHSFNSVPVVFAIYFPFMALRIWWAAKNQITVAVSTLYTIIDIFMVLGLIWLYHIEYVMPLGFSLRSPTFQFLAVIISLRALTMRPSLVVLATFCAVAGWTALLTAAATEPHAEITRSFVEYTSSGKILIGAEIEKILSLVVQGFCLAIAVYGAQQLLLESATKRSQTENLSLFFSPQVADLIKSGKLILKAGHGFKRIASVLFIDLRGFTRLSNTLDADGVMKILTEYHAHIVPVILKNRGVLDKFMGDGILAHFGAAVENKTHSADCIRTIEEIIVATENWNFERRELNQNEIEINMAAANGPLIFGATGDNQRMEMTIIGNPVNMAAKLEKNNKELNAVATVTARVRSLAEEQGYHSSMRFEIAQNQNVEGTHEPIELHYISKKQIHFKKLA